MVTVFLAQARWQWPCVFMLTAVVGCSGAGGRATPTGQPPANLAQDDNRADADEDKPMARQPKHGFKEYVKNPDLWREEIADAANADPQHVPTPQELAALVSAMGQRRLEYAELQQVRNAGDKVVPLLLASLRDEKFLFHRYGPSVLDGSAIETALDLLEPFALPEVSLLEPALATPMSSSSIAHCTIWPGAVTMMRSMHSPSG